MGISERRHEEDLTLPLSDTYLPYMACYVSSNQVVFPTHLGRRKARDGKTNIHGQKNGLSGRRNCFMEMFFMAYQNS